MRDRAEVLFEFKKLIEKYVSNKEKMAEYIKEIETIYPPPVRGIIYEMEKDGIAIKKEDVGIVDDVFYYYG